MTTATGERQRVNPFGDGVGYVRIKLATLMAKAQSADYDLPTRVEFAALARCNRDGHAEFAVGELAFILGATDEAGTWRPASSVSASRAITKAKARGAIRPESGARCLVVPGYASQGRGTSGCRVHWSPVNPTG